MSQEQRGRRPEQPAVVVSAILERDQVQRGRVDIQEQALWRHEADEASSTKPAQAAEPPTRATSSNLWPLKVGQSGAKDKRALDANSERKGGGDGNDDDDDEQSDHSAGDERGPRGQRKQKQRSASIQFELKRIKMQERLLKSNQQKLINQLRAPSPVGGNKVAPSERRRHEFKVQMAPLDETRASPPPPPPLAERSAAIECRKLTYQAGLGPLQRTILHGLDLTVPEGAIYGLLGPSGCGKTTLLRCVAGRLKPSAGSLVRVFGFAPNERGSQIPGPAIGYMPQEVSVYDEFTIDETLTYFGRINRMRRTLLAIRIDFLLKFLDLPPKRRLISTLSGGQKRRVSLAIALVHAPPLVILDEPTVGVDPLLRQVIWNYLVTLATNDKITIVITTHYIEEARQANIVGLMRGGRLLAENEPDELMRQAGVSNLEDVFLRLCVVLDHEQGEERGDERAYKSESESEEASDLDGDAGIASDATATSEQDSTDYSKLAMKRKSHEVGSNRSLNSAAGESVLPLAGSRETRLELTGANAASKLQSASRRRPNEEAGSKFISGPQCKPMIQGQKYAGAELDWLGWLSILMAVTWKNYLRLRRNLPVLAFEFLLPALQVVLFCLCIGGPPYDIPLAVVNEEVVPQASRLFLNSLNKQTFNQVAHANLSSAIASVRSGESWAVVHIPRGYTKSLNDRLLHPADVANETLANGTISIYPDLTNLHLALAIEGAFKDAFVKFTRDSLDLLGYEPQLAELPIKLAEPVYGRLANSSATSASGYLEFMAPGVVISITYVMATGLTALAFILEKRDGLLERSQISGVTVTQTLLAHTLLQVFVMLLQILLVLAVTFYAFQVPSYGPYSLVVLLVLLQGCAGMAYGLLISAVCSDENAAIMMLVGSFYINLILAGIMWPIEAMPRWLRSFSYFQPQTLPILGLRNIMARGWSIEEPSVQIAFATTIGWLLLFLFVAGFCMRHIK